MGLGRKEYKLLVKTFFLFFSYIRLIVSFLLMNHRSFYLWPMISVILYNNAHKLEILRKNCILFSGEGKIKNNFVWNEWLYVSTCHRWLFISKEIAMPLCVQWCLKLEIFEWDNFVSFGHGRLPCLFTFELRWSLNRASGFAFEVVRGNDSLRILIPFHRGNWRTLDRIEQARKERKKERQEEKRILT